MSSAQGGCQRTAAVAAARAGPLACARHRRVGACSSGQIMYTYQAPSPGGERSASKSKSLAPVAFGYENQPQQPPQQQQYQQQQQQQQQQMQHLQLQHQQLQQQQQQQQVNI